MTNLWFVGVLKKRLLLLDMMSVRRQMLTLERNFGKVKVLTLFC